ncbi:hypothetical protein DEJ25_15110 [Curtobacterium sp. MCPF17_011]|uniref:hypothetical protein n=1 Tax=unclassified Curtobacterium TaxID=257496 RepID=UPI000D943FEB|nr:MULTISPECIES: hypothetical protein [unclassified Curtobacterium]PYY35717.1 hypothetical protein DEI89_05360 [Curtobacterium sp. MCBD17_030]PZF09160.1 hypothetical protein DEJ25_15110 [Curtobacterium sp. MCPF17_011]
MSDSINQWGGSATKAEVAPQIVVRRPLFPGVIFLALGLIGLVIGVPGLVFQLIAGSDDSPAFGIFIVLGAGSLLLGLALAAGRINVYDRHYDVKSGFGKFRRREVEDIHTLRLGKQSNGSVTFISLTAWNEQRKKQFMVFTNYRGYREFTAWLDKRRPEQWAECERLGLPD